jgi:hypothetical protein
LQLIVRVPPQVWIPMCWGFVNGIPAVLFFHYCITSGRSFRWNCRVMRVLGVVAALASFVFAWLSLPAEVDLSPVLAKGLGFISAQKADGVKVGCKAPSLLHRRAQCQHRAQAAMSRHLA